MTVTANTTRNDYTAGSAQSVYNYTFQLNEAADVDVYLDGVKQTLNTHYTVQNVGNASGGTIVFTLEDENGDPIHPTQGAIINIVMAMDLDRDTNYQPSGAFLAADVNNDFDRLWLATNQQQTAVNRALRLKDTDVTTSSMELPLKDDRKGKMLGFNATTGDPEVSTHATSNWDTAYDNMITSASFTGGNYILTQQDGGTISTSLDGRYLQLTGGTLTGDLNVGFNDFTVGRLSISGVYGDNTLIRETGGGDLFIQATNLNLESAINDTYISCTADGDVKLFYDNAEKLATTSTGISITGTLSTSNIAVASGSSLSFGNSAFLISSNGTETIMRETGSGDLSIEGQNLYLRSSPTANYLSGTAGAEVKLYHNNSEKLATTSGGISVTGTLTATGYNDSNWNAAYNDKINSASFDTSNGVLTLTQQDGGTVTVDLDGRYSNDTGIALGDNQKATFGDGNDLQIYHTGSESRIEDAGTGLLTLRSQGTGIQFWDTANGGYMLNATVGGAIDLYHNRSKKLATTSTGIDVTGTATMDGLTVETSNTGNGINYGFDIKNSASGNSTSYAMPAISWSNGGLRWASVHGERKSTGGFGGNLVFNTMNTSNSATKRMGIDYNGDISFYEDTGTTAKLFWDASAERLGIGTTSPNSTLHVKSSGTNSQSLLRLESSSGTRAFIGSDAQDDSYLYLYDSSDTLKTAFRTDGNHSYIAGGGNVGIGTTTPASHLEIRGSSGGNDKQLRLSTGSTTYWDLGRSGVNGNFEITEDSGNTYFVIDKTSGNVGIGTTSPDYPLEVSKVGTSGTGTIGLVPDSDNGHYIRYGGSGTNNNVFRILGTGNTERMRIDASGNLLVGTTSQISSGKISVAGGTSANGITATTAATSGYAAASLQRTASDGELISFKKGVNNVGSIGTKSGDLTVGTGDTGLRFDDANNAIYAHSMSANGYLDATVDLGYSGIRFKDIYLSGGLRVDGTDSLRSSVDDSLINISGGNATNSGANYALFGETHASLAGVHRWRTDGNERMRIDSSGNLLVGTTNPNNVSDGVRLKPDGFISAANTSGSVMYANRLTTDGSIIDFQKDGTTVGSIGTGGGDLNIGTGDTRIRFNDATDNIIPLNASNGYRNAAISIGDSTARFKDLYLSGTGYFGTSVGIGTTSPQDALHIKSSTTDARLLLDGHTNFDAELKFAENGSVKYTVGHDAATDTFRIGTTNVDTNPRLVIDSAGNVGIGTTSPARALHVSSGTTNEVARFESTDTACLVEFKDTTGTASIETRNDFRFSAGGTERLRINSSGNVGIGTTSPAANLHVDASAPEFRLSQSGTAKVRLRTTGDNYINTGQNLGIGTTSPSQLLHVNGTARATTVLSGDGTASAPAYAFSNDTDTGIFRPFPDTLAFSEGGVERMRINSSGNVGIGVTSISAKLHIAGSFLSTGPVSCGSGGTISSAGYQNTPAFIIKSWTSTSTTYYPMLRFATSDSTEVGTIKSNNTGTQYNTSSDVRLKENIRDAEDAGAKIDAIQIRQFDWKNGGEHQDYGVIAQELKEVAPEAVSEGNDEEEMWGVDYSKLVPTLIKEIQSLRNRVAELEKK